MPAHKINCPICQQPMTKFQAPGNVEIDSCNAHGVWLDSNELEMVVRQAGQPEAASGGPGVFEGAGRTFVQSAVGGAGFSLANTLIRKLFG